jgi:hypothetical protein
MKFWTLVTGVVLGFLIADNVSTEQRSKARSLGRRVRNGRAGTVVGTVGHGIGDIADAATDRVTVAVDHATTNVADLVTSPHAESSS